MKKVFLALSVALVALVSCSKDENSGSSVGDTHEAYIDATSKTTWNYYSLEENKLVGTGEETDESNQAWSERTDWDIAVCRYSIRTNSGAATSVDAKGGVYTFGASVPFASITSIPENVAFAADKAITSEGMGGTTTSVKSEATVILFKTNEDGSTIMPPVYLQAPVYLFRTADGKNYYKVQFTQYQDENSVTGHVKFNSAQIR